MPTELPNRASSAIETAVVSVCGPVRPENEDAALVFTGEAGQVVGIVSDGMGGHQAGREAAEIVVRVASERLRSGRGAQTWEGRLEQALAAAHAEVRSAAQARSQPGMGATALFAVVEEQGGQGVLHLAHVGDSRSYLLRGRSLFRLTADHSLVGQLSRDGHLTDREAFEHPDRNVLQRAVGQEAPLAAEVHSPIALDAGDRLLLTSDGLHGVLPDAEIAHWAGAGRTAAEICDRLVEAALLAASDDNISVVCLRLSEAPCRPTRPGATRVAARSPA